MVICLINLKRQQTSIRPVVRGLSKGAKGGEEEEEGLTVEEMERKMYSGKKGVCVCRRRRAELNV